MNLTIEKAVADILSQYAKRDPDLVNEVQDKLRTEGLAPLVDKAANKLSLPSESRFRAIKTITDSDEFIPEAEARIIAETIAKPALRPVLKIRDNTLVMEFFASADSGVWRGRLDAAKSVLDAAIPAVGRVEVTNHPGYTWVGTGWLLSDDVVVTNRHVAREFARRDNKQFLFRMGPAGPMTCRIDFLEEFERSRTLEFEASEVLWIAPTDEADIAFLRITRNSNGTPLPRPISLSTQTATEDQFVVTIGYPARDDDFPDQDLARRVFGDVYDKKRLAPGQVLESPDDLLLHDCSTLGGNSGSVVLDLNSGEAVALHYAGLFPKANYAVPAALVSDRFKRVLHGDLAPVISSVSTPAKKSDEPRQQRTPPALTTPVTATFVIPLEISISLGVATIRVGDTTVSAGVDTATPVPGTSASSADSDKLQAALTFAREALRGNKDILEVRLGYRFKNGWITDEQVVVVEVKDDSARVPALGKESIPAQFNGIDVEVRLAPLVDQLRAEGIALPVIEERVAKGTYRKPTHLTLKEVKNQPMVAVFHVSPDSGFPNLRKFLSRTQNRVTATMYEFEAPHILTELLNAVRPAGRSLTMVTQKEGTKDSVKELSHELDNRFDHVWASAANAISVDTNLLFPTAYHIKVAVRDGKEVWLSSGNWKGSGQPNIDPAGNNQTSWGPLRNKNREWHAVIENQTLATLFEEYIRYDLSEAHRVPLPEAIPFKWPEIFVPEVLPRESQLELPARYFNPLVVTRPLHIQPLLTPDNFIESVTGLIEDAQRSIYVENQSFNLLEPDEDGSRGNNEQAFYELLSLLRDRQATHDVKIIFRDASEFPGNAGNAQKRLLERLQRFGFDMENNVKVQIGCHTKGVIIDSEKVLLGSHNWTNQGALYNRDASLIVYDAEVARYFESIFLFDWEHLARQRSGEELPSGTRLARAGEETPSGMRRISLADVLYDFIE